MAEIFIADKDLGRIVDETVKNNTEYQSIENPKEKVIDLYKKLTDTTSKLSDVNEKIVDLCLKIIQKEELNKNRVVETQKTTIIPSVIPNDSNIGYNNKISRNRNTVRPTITGRMLSLGSNVVKRTARNTVNNVDNFLSREVPFYSLFKSTAGITSKLVGSAASGILHRNKNQSNILSNTQSNRVNTGIFGIFGSNQENTEIGISRRPLAENRVLRYSTIGIAAVWLAKQLNRLKKGDNDFDFGDLVQANLATRTLISGGGGLFKTLKNIIFHPFKTLAATITAIVTTFVKAIPTMALAAAGVLTVTDLLERKSVEEITGKATQDVTTFDSIISTISQGLLGNVGTGTEEERNANASKQALKLGLGGAWLGSKMPGGIKGKIIGTGIGLGVGALSGFFGGRTGGDNIAKNIIDTKDSLTGALDETAQSTKALNDTYKKKDDRVADSTKQIEKFTEEIKKTTNIWSSFWGTADDVLDVDFNIDDGVSSGNYMKLDYKQSTLDNAVNLITGQESSRGAGGVNRNDNGAGFSIGSLQYNWKWGNALNYINTLAKNDKDNLIEQYMGKDFVKWLNDEWARGNKHVTLTEYQKKQWERMIEADKAGNNYLVNADRQFTENKVKNYLAAANEFGISDEGLKIIFANMANQYGAGGTRKLFRAAGFKRGQSLDEISNNLQRVIKNKYGTPYVNRYNNAVASVRYMQEQERLAAQQQVQPNEQKPSDKNLSEQTAEKEGKAQEAKKGTQQQVSSVYQTIQDEQQKYANLKQDIILDNIRQESTTMANAKNMVLMYNLGGGVGGEFADFIRMS